MLELEKKNYYTPKEPNFEFYVLNWDMDARKIVSYNIFNNWHVYDEALKLTKKHLCNKKKFPREDYVEELRRTIQWQEWSRVEYEISAGEPFETDAEKPTKLDCYMQAFPNMEIIADMCINRYKQWKKNDSKRNV